MFFGCSEVSDYNMATVVDREADAHQNGDGRNDVEMGPTTPEKQRWRL